MPQKPHESTRSGVGWGVLVLVLVIEALGGVAVLWSVIGGFFAADDEPIGPRVVILLGALIAWAWVCVTLGGALRRRAGWARGSALTIHVLIFAAATGILQGIFDAPRLGWGLVFLALIGFFAAMLARPVETETPGGGV